MTWIPLNLLRFVLWPRIWAILVHVPFALEKNMYFAFVRGVLCSYHFWWSSFVCVNLDLLLVSFCFHLKDLDVSCSAYLLWWSVSAKPFLFYIHFCFVRILCCQIFFCQALFLYQWSWAFWLWYNLKTVFMFLMVGVHWVSSVCDL